MAQPLKFPQSTLLPHNFKRIHLALLMKNVISSSMQHMPEMVFK